MNAWIETLPAGAFLLVLTGWALGAVLGGVLTARLAPAAKIRHAIILGVLLLVASIANMVTIPHPIWMWGGAFAVFVPGAYLGARMIDRRGRGTAAVTPTPA